jgi:hypothetical protein
MILALLQQCLRDQGRYLDAFEVKRERLAVEQQYGLRALSGRGGCDRAAHRTAGHGALPSGSL